VLRRYPTENLKSKVGRGACCLGKKRRSWAEGFGTRGDGTNLPKGEKRWGGRQTCHGKETIKLGREQKRNVVAKKEGIEGGNLRKETDPHLKPRGGGDTRAIIHEMKLGAQWGA